MVGSITRYANQSAHQTAAAVHGPERSRGHNLPPYGQPRDWKKSETIEDFRQTVSLAMSTLQEQLRAGWSLMLL